MYMFLTERCLENFSRVRVRARSLLYSVDFARVLFEESLKGKKSGLPLLFSRDVC